MVMSGVVTTHYFLYKVISHNIPCKSLEFRLYIIT
nr:MAG TPA: hypothetical protein [Bacteriophage sp.]